MKLMSTKQQTAATQVLIKLVNSQNSFWQ